ncbi:MAG TPA: heat-inducible transcriptional repressor HrcA [Pyrinomonadaceae bacterium]|nr:heat-inducible transcriptional repressor HrcA [Pyrinomonadaceae bacterium]
MPVRDSNLSFKNDSPIPDARGQIVLSAIISEHLISGEPVGSKVVAERFAHSAGWSSATIRNVMSELEDGGFVEQPHTSAGRVPTDKGYRFYVDNLLGVLSLSTEDLNLINRELGLSELDISDKSDRLMERTSQLLSVLSDNVGIVISPNLANDYLQHIQFANLSDKRILVVMVSAPNIVHNKIIRLEETISQEDLDRTSRYINAEFAGKSLAMIRSEILRLMHEEKALFDKLLQTAMILCSQSIESEKDTIGEIYVDGTLNILTKPDFSNFERLRELLRTIEEKSRLMQILNECLGRDLSAKGNVQVVIGSENSTSSLQNCTLITAPYRIGKGDTLGTLSVLGPTRIEYPRMIAIVSYISKILEKMMLDEYSVSKKN